MKNIKGEHIFVWSRFFTEHLMNISLEIFFYQIRNIIIYFWT